MEKLLHFSLTYQNYVFLAMFGLLAIVALVNFAHNPYATQNAKLKKFNKKILQKPGSLVTETNHLPTEYQRQWRAFVNSCCNKPSVVFEFVKRPQRYLLWFAHAVCLAVSIAYIVLSIFSKDGAIFAVQMAFLLSSVLVVLLTRLIGKINLSRARRVFGKFLYNLNRVTHIFKREKREKQQPTMSTDKQCVPQAQVAPVQNGAVVQTPTPVSTPLEPTQCTQTMAPTDGHPTDTNNAQQHPSNPVPAQTPTEIAPMPTTTQPSNQPPTIVKNCGDVVENAVQILRQKGLENPRTAEEQRKLNIALNNLLQACCKRSN